MNDIVKGTGISMASLYHILKKRSVNGNFHNPEHQFQRQKRGRPAKLSSRDKMLLLREIPSLRKEEGQLTMKRLMFQAGIAPKQVSYRTVERFLSTEGFQYLQARKKGIITEKNLKERLKFAQKMQREYDDQFWKNRVFFFFLWMESALSISIIQVINHAHQSAVFGGNRVKDYRMVVGRKERIRGVVVGLQNLW